MSVSHPVDKETFGIQEEYQKEENKIKVETYDSQGFENAPFYYKLITLLCTISLAAGGHFGSNIVNSLKSKLKAELHITNTQYGSLESGLFVVNSFMPLIGGLVMDIIGTTQGSILATTLSTLGNLIVAFGAHYRSFGVMVLGRVIFGLGHGCIKVAQETILNDWFRGKGLSFVIGLAFATSKVFSVAAQGSGASLVGSNTSFSSPFWLAFGLAGFSWVVNLVYVILVHRAKTKFQPNTNHQSNQSKKRIAFNTILELPKRYWLLPFIIFLFDGVWTPFLHILSEFLKLNFNQEDLKAGWYSTISLAFPIALAPLTGLFIEFFGLRGVILTISAILTFTSMMLLRLTKLEPAIGLVLYSIAISLAPVSLVSSIPLILPKRLSGTAFGFYISAANTGVSLFDIIVGRIQDAQHHSYNGVLTMFCCQSFIVILIFGIYNFIDFKYNHWIWNVNSKQRQLLLKDKMKLDIENKDNEKKSVWNWILPIIFLCILIAGVIIYFIHLKV